MSKYVYIKCQNMHICDSILGYSINREKSYDSDQCNLKNKCTIIPGSVYNWYRNYFDWDENSGQKWIHFVY